jgi:hypothetical protein
LVLVQVLVLVRETRHQCSSRLKGTFYELLSRWFAILRTLTPTSAREKVKKHGSRWMPLLRGSGLVKRRESLIK